MRFEAEARVARRGKESIAWGVGLAALVIAVVAAVQPGLLIPFTVLAAGGALVGYLGRYHHRPAPARVLVSADRRGLGLAGALVPRETIKRAHVGKMQDGHALHVDVRGRAPSYSVVFEDEAVAGAALRALHLETGSSIARFRALPPWSRHLRTLAVVLTTSPWILFNFLRWLPLWSWAVIASAYGVIALPVLMPQRVEVGQDGVLLRWLKSRRFVPFSAIETAAATATGVTLFLRDGREVEIRLGYKDEGSSTERSRLLSCIHDGIEAQVDQLRADEEGVLARGERDLDVWIRDMRALGDGGAGGYRAMAIPHERLWSVLESPAADPSAREGAAIALHGVLDEEAREKLRELAQTTASPRLRVALDRLSKESDVARLRVALEAAAEEDAEPPSGTTKAARVMNRSTK